MMDKSELLDLYRARHDVIRGVEEGHQFWMEHYTYLPGKGWIEDGDDPNHPAMLIESTPDFTLTTLMVDRGEGAPAAYCYRCPMLLTLDEIQIDSPKAGLYRPVCKDCKDCKDEIDREA